MRRIRPLLADHRVRLALLAAALVGGYFLLKAVLPDIDLQELLDDLAAALGDWTYLLVGAFAFLETGAFVGLVAPGETVVILAGAIAGVGETSLVLTMWIVWSCAFAGDSASFLLGRRLGRGFIVRHGPRLRITNERFEGVERYFQRHGGKTILIGRFIGLVRALAPFIAGSSGMRYRAFAPFSVLGTGLWGIGFTLLGYFASRSLEEAAQIAGRGTLLFGIAVAVIVAIVLATRYLRDEANRRRLVAGMERRPLLRPLVVIARRVWPQVRFVWARLTPGELGLELTTLVAALAVGLFVLIGYATTVGADPGPTGADTTAMDIADKLRGEWQTDLNLAITQLGNGYVALAVAAVAGALLALRRRWTEVAVVAAAALILVVAIAELKGLLDRPRPTEPLTDADGGAFPSGHAAYSVIYVWLAVVIARELKPDLVWSRLTARAVVVTAGIVLAAAIGLSRVYLGVHWWSDVAGGWALGVATFSLCGVVALVVSHLRENGGGE